jgi:hypothetical protein
LHCRIATDDSASPEISALLPIFNSGLNPFSPADLSIGAG